MDLIKKKVIIFSIYRASSGNFDYFLNTLDYILNSLHIHNTKFIICEDININYLDTNDKKKQLDTLLGTYNLKGAVYFPTVTSISFTMIDNIQSPPKKCKHTLTKENSMLYVSTKFNYTSEVEYKLQQSTVQALFRGDAVNLSKTMAEEAGLVAVRGLPDLPPRTLQMVPCVSNLSQSRVTVKRILDIPL